MIEFIKTRNVKNPIRNEVENAGIDFFIPEKDSYTEAELANLGTDIRISDNTITIMPHTSILIPSGIKSKFSNNLALIANNKSGIATKKKLIFGASTIDCSYQGEWHFHLINYSNEPQEVEFGQKIIQFIPHVISTDKMVIRDMTEQEFFTETTTRGTGGFGSTGV